MTSSNKRERELARAKYERQQARRSQRQHNRRRNQRITAVVVVGAMVLVFGGWVAFNIFRGDDSSSAPVAEASPAVIASCTSATPSAAVPQSFAAAPKVDTSFPSGTTITFGTNCGDIVVRTLPKLAPATVTSEIYLAQQGFYDQTPCHRLTTAGIFVLQCGDPTGTGTGGPGYTLPDENLPAKTSTTYPAGTVAMANAGTGTSGSQFFIVYADSVLGPNYTVWGKVTSGLDNVKSVAAAGVADGGSDGAPAQTVVIQTATVSKS
ncbi:MAG: peptidylprolyl isomerase [Actinomycetota bacterium]|nr:peptidylprolyl isomerase [Actinomycetota bacterium]